MSKRLIFSFCLFHASKKGFCHEDLLVISMDDPADKLVVRFHFFGELVGSGKSLRYVGGRTATTHIGPDKISLPEIRGHLADHVTVKDNWRFHWLYPGLPLYAGLSLLVNDVLCMRMSNYIKDGAFVDIYVEEPATEAANKSDEAHIDVTIFDEDLMVLESQILDSAKKVDSQEETNKFGCCA